MACVLLVEDDLELRHTLAGILEYVGHVVVQADEGAHGVAEIDHCHPDVIISDMVMDGMEGISTVLSVRETHPELPILAISGNAMYLSHAEKLGADASLLKPFTSQAFLDLVDGLLTDQVRA